MTLTGVHGLSADVIVSQVSNVADHNLIKGITHKRKGITHKRKGITHKRKGITHKRKGLPIKEKGLPIKKGLPVKEKGLQSSHQLFDQSIPL